MFYCGSAEIERFERIGVDVEVEGEDNRQLLIQQGLEKGWVTDHLGVMADFALSGVEGHVQQELESDSARL